MSGIVFGNTFGNAFGNAFGPQKDLLTQTLTNIESPFKNNAEMFNNKEMFPDMEFVIPGLDSPLLLHKGIMAKTSKLVQSILKAKETAKNDDVNRIEWMFDTSKPVDMTALLKVLRFCYDETMSVDISNGECCAVIAALFRLQLTRLDKIVGDLISFAVKQSQCNANNGVKLLKDTKYYPECCGSRGCGLDKALGKAVLTAKNIKEKYEIVVDDCMMKLPPEYLDVAEYGQPHTKFSEFSIRARYVAEHSETLSNEEKEAIMKKCDWTKLQGSELKQLKDLGFVGQEVIMEAYEKVLETTEQKMCEWKQHYEKIENDCLQKMSDI